MAASADLVARASAREFMRLYPSEAARALETLDAADVARALEASPTADAARVLERLIPDLAGQLVAALHPDRLREIVPAVDPARAATMLAWVDEPVRLGVLELLDSAAARELTALMSYPPDTAGRLMDPRATALRLQATVTETLARLRAERQRRVDSVFVVDDEGKLVGSVALQDVILSPVEASLSALMRTAPARVEVMTPRDEVVELLTQLRIASLPVVDVDGRLVGVIRHDALVRAVQEEFSADIQTMVGASKEERALSPVWFGVKKRLPWLEINLATAFLAAAVVGVFEDLIARFTALAVLLPVVAGQSGNTGAQALAVTMRGLALREIRLRHWLQVSRKEVSVAFLNGIAVAVTTALGVYLWSQSLGLALVIGVSMIISMVAAGISGAAIPMVLTAAGQDPAQSSSIILTTVTDVVGFFSFLGIATLLAAML